MDLRVEDNPEPLKELKRLIDIHQGYQCMERGEHALEKKDFNEKAINIFHEVFY